MIPRQTSLLDAVWIPVKDGNDTARSIFDQHYSRYIYADGRQPKLFVGPGEKLVLVTTCARALFVWRKFRSMNDQQGVNCSVFRNEGARLSSELILKAEDIARERWPKETRFYTYVNPRKVRSPNPGYCFIAAGWKPVGYTKRQRLRILAKEFASGP